MERTIIYPQLENCFKLASKITLYIPATNAVNEPIDNSAHVAEAAELLAKCFGGATASQALGYWLSPAKGLVAEGTTIVFAYAANSALKEHLASVVMYCKGLKARLAQEAIALELNGEMYFV